MKDVELLEVKQTRVYAADQLPFHSFIFPPIGAAFKERFGWTELSMEGTEVALGPGFFPSKDRTEAIVIRRLQMGERRIIVSVTGSSEQAHQVYQGIVDCLAELTGRAEWKAAPAVFVEETTAVATLDFDWSKLLNPALAPFVRSAIEATSGEHGRARIKAFSMGFKIAYEPGRMAQDIGISISEKLLTIEPREGAAPSDRRFFSRSPTSSDTHIGLLKQLEELLSSTA